MTPTQIITAIALAIGATAGGAGAWQWQSGRVAAAQLELSNERLDRANERIAIQRAARQVAERLASQVIKAQNDAAARNVRLAADRSSAADAGSGLRIASTDTLRTSAADLEACTRSLDAHSVVLGELSQFAEGLAIAADSWASHAVALQDAWPR